ncbi:MAG: ion transporter, partial [Bacteroidota bacterium]
LKARRLFAFIEWFVTILFTVEYILRVIATPRPTRYIFSTIGFIDFISVFPTYLTLFLLSTTNYLAVVRLVRLFRLFRVFDSKEYSKYTREAGYLSQALKNSQRKISIFILIVMISVTIIGSLMYVIERDGNPGFNSIPRSIYWAIVTLTTVGYGDIAPQTSLGQTLASFLMLMGFSTIVVFTSIVGAEVYRQRDEKRSLSNSKSCLECNMTGHEEVASYCKYCGGRLWG